MDTLRNSGLLMGMLNHQGSTDPQHMLCHPSKPQHHQQSRNLMAVVKGLEAAQGRALEWAPGWALEKASEQAPQGWALDWALGWALEEALELQDKRGSKCRWCPLGTSGVQLHRHKHMRTQSGTSHG